jgi:hypothetical protein
MLNTQWMLLSEDCLRGNWLNPYRHRAGGVKDLLCFAVPIRSSELSPVKEKQDDTDRGKNECDSDPRLSSRGQLVLRLQIIPESGTEKDYR